MLLELVTVKAVRARKGRETVDRKLVPRTDGRQMTAAIVGAWLEVATLMATNERVVQLTG